MSNPNIPEGRQAQDPRYLSASFGGGEDDSSRPRSVSSASSMRTVVEEADDLIGGIPTFQRRRTAVVDVEFTWRDLFKGLFLGPNSVRQKLAATVTTATLQESDDDIIENKPNPFVQEVIVFPCPDSDVVQRHEAHCILDTANQQGNIISTEFAKTLGYKKWRPLQGMEGNGASVMSGDIHHVVGALKITWCHYSSPKVYRNMRFLVSETAKVDLVIGNKSITEYHLIAPPNFMNGKNGKEIIDIEVTEPDRENLKSAEASWKDTLRAHRKDRESKKKRNAWTAKDEEEIKNEENEYERAKARVELYDTQRQPASDSRASNEKELEEQIEKLEAQLPRFADKTSKAESSVAKTDTK